MGVGQQCVLDKYSNKLICAVEFESAVVENGVFRLDLINIGVKEMSGVLFYGREDLMETYRTTKLADMNLKQDVIKATVVEGRWFVDKVNYLEMKDEINVAFILSYTAAIPLYILIGVGLILGAENPAYNLINLLSILNVVFLTDIDYGRATEEFIYRLNRSVWTLLWNPIKEILVIPCSLTRRFNYMGFTCLYLDNFGGFAILFFLIIVLFAVKFILLRVAKNRVYKGEKIGDALNYAKKMDCVINKHFAHKVVKFTFVDLVLHSLIQVKAFGYITAYHIFNCLVGVVSFSIPIAFMIITEYRWRVRKTDVKTISDSEAVRLAHQSSEKKAQESQKEKKRKEREERIK